MMKEIFKMQLQFLLLITWVLGTITPLLYAMFEGSNLAGVFGTVFFLVFMYPMAYIFRKLN